MIREKKNWWLKPIKMLDTSGLDIGKASFFVSSSGDCMNHPSSPLRIQDGDVIGMHEIKIVELEQYKGRMVAVQLKAGHKLVKELAGLYESTSFVSAPPSSKGIILKCYNPKTMLGYFPFSSIARAFAVDCAFPKADIKFI